MIQVLANTVVVIILQYITAANHIVCFQLTQCYMSIISIKLEEKQKFLQLNSKKPNLESWSPEKTQRNMYK